MWGIFAAPLQFLPYLGIVIAACFPIALALAVDPGWTLLVWVILLFVGTELVVANLLEPWVYADSTGLSSVALIAAATFWTWLWGPIGLLLSTPLTVCLVVLGRHVPQLEYSPVRARYLVRRLRRRAPRAKVLVGFWRLDPCELTATVAAIARPNTAAVTSLREAIISLQSDLSTDGGAGPAGPAIRATAVG